MLKANSPNHSPATGLGHITASRSHARFSRTRPLPKRTSTYIPEPQFLTQPVTTSPNADATSSSSDSEASRPHIAMRAQTRSSLRFTTQLTITPHSFTTTKPHSLTSHPKLLNTLTENVDHYPLDQRPDNLLRATVVHSSEFRNHAVFSEPTGR